MSRQGQHSALAEPRVAGLVPVHDAGPALSDVLEALRGELGPEALLVVVDDGSTDGSRELLERRANDLALVIVDGPGRGLAAALNRGLEEIDRELVAQVDHDVVVRPGWLAALERRLADPEVAAAQGRYVAPPGAPLPARVDCLDLDARWSRLRDGESDHVATGNTVYRRKALKEIGGFDESLGYGTENDLSYRLREAGRRLVVEAAAVAEHHGRGTWRSWWRAQVGQGWGRLDLIARHPERIGGDRVSGPGMILRVPATLAALGLLAAALVLGRFARRTMGRLGLGLLAVLGMERFATGIAVARQRADPAALAFPLVHLLRDLAWCRALVGWSLHRLRGLPPAPTDSMPRSR